MTRMNTALSLSLVLALAGCAGLASRPPAASAPPATSAGVVDIATAPSDWSALDGRAWHHARGDLGNLAGARRERVAASANLRTPTESR